MKCLVSLSGGLDSATVLATALDQGRNVAAVGFFYASKHNLHENAAAERLAAYYRVPFQLLDLSAVMAGFKSNLLASGDALPIGHYQEENMRLTVVPNRNMIFLSLLTGLAISQERQEIWLGIHAGDHFIYPDCRPEFVTAAQQALRLATDTTLTLVAPFLHATKKQIIERGKDLHVPYQLTRTCYTSQSLACGMCGSCQERLEAFSELGLEDPLPYVSRELLPKSNASLPGDA